MKRKLLLACAAILVIAMIIVPVMAAPATANPLDQILSNVKDYKTKLDTILTKLTALQTDVTTIKTTTNTINTKISTPAEPTSYEYYTHAMATSYYDGQVAELATLTNAGDSTANVCWYKYWKKGLDPWELQTSKCTTIEPGEVKTCSPTFTTVLSIAYRIKITTDSKYVVPYVLFYETDNYRPIFTYLPGDFQKVEIYS